MYCGKCGQKLENNARFCPNCGNQIKAEYRDTIYKADRGAKKNKVKWSFILAACLLCLTGGVIMGSLIVFGPVGNRTENELSSDRQQETAVDESDMNADSEIAAEKDTALEQYMEEG